MITTIPTIVQNALMNAETLCERPSWTNYESDCILDTKICYLKNVSLQISPVRLSSKNETSFLIKASKSLERRLRPILSEVIPKNPSLIKELTAPIHMNTTHVMIFFITSLWSPDFIALIAIPIKLGKKKSVILPKNMNGKPKSSIYHCSPKNIKRSFYCCNSAILSFGFFGGTFFLFSTAFDFSGYF